MRCAAFILAVFALQGCAGTQQIANLWRSPVEQQTKIRHLSEEIRELWTTASQLRAAHQCNAQEYSELSRLLHLANTDKDRATHSLATWIRGAGTEMGVTSAIADARSYLGTKRLPDPGTVRQLVELYRSRPAGVPASNYDVVVSDDIPIP